MTETPLEALVAKLEAATAPDRALDKAIVLALYPQAIVDIYCVGDFEPVVFHAEPLVQNKYELPRYTASLDAALSLYKVKPDRIPSDPIKATIEALRQW